MSAWIRAARTPRMLGILVFLVAAAIVCVRLGAWQIDRSLEGQRIAQAAVQRAAEDAAPVELHRVLSPQESMTQAMVNRQVVINGEFDAEVPAFVIAGRTHAGQEGNWVIWPLRDSHSGAWVPVIAGWAPTSDEARLMIPADREVEVTGFLMATEGAESISLERQELGSLSTAQLANVWGTPMLNAFVALTEVDGRALTEPVPIEMTVPDSGVGPNLRNLLYAAEWFIFGGFALFLYARMLRDEVGYQRLDESEYELEEGGVTAVEPRDGLEPSAQGSEPIRLGRR